MSIDNDSSLSTILLLLAAVTVGYMIGLLTCDMLRQALLESLP